MPLLTPKQHFYAEGRIAGLNQKQAAIQAGYSAKTSVTKTEKRVLPAIALRLDKYGLGDEFLLGKLREGIEGQPSAVQARYLEMALKARGAFEHDKQMGQEERHMAFLSRLIPRIEEAPPSCDDGPIKDAGQCAPQTVDTVTSLADTRSGSPPAAVDEDGE